jgi:phasin protein
VPNQYQRGGGAGDAGRTPSISWAPGVALTVWNPFLGLNADALGGFNTLAREWEDFVGRRLKEDVALVQRLTRVSTPEQILSAYADFWRKAGEDYGKEITTMTELMTDMTSKMAVAAKSATDEVSTKLLQREAA